MLRLHTTITSFIGRHRYALAGFLLGSVVLIETTHAAPQPAQSYADAADMQRLHAWRSLIEQAKTLRETQKLAMVNTFFNRHIRYAEDRDVWMQTDYWASPLETLRQGAGDCEDFALAKYFTLRQLGISEKQLRLTYTVLPAVGQAHMVLGFWPDDDTEPLLLDNLNLAILPISQRHDLQMQFAFDETQLYRFEKNDLLAVGRTTLLPQWPALMLKIQGEGFTTVTDTANSASSLFQASTMHAQQYAALDESSVNRP